MMEIKSVVIAVAKPAGRGDLGQCAEGFYTREGDVISLVSREGEPLRDENTGDRITAHLNGELEKVVAKRMTLRLYRAERGDEVSSAFNRRISYGRNGYA
jgi:hypothetical protein